MCNVSSDGYSVISLSGTDLKKIEEFSINFVVELKKDYVYSAGQMIEFVFPESYLIPIVRDETDIPQINNGEHSGNGEISYIVTEDRIKIRFKQDYAVTEQTKVLDSFRVDFMVNQETLSVYKPVRQRIIINDLVQAVIELPVYEIPSGITQEYSDRWTEEESDFPVNRQLLNWHVTVGTQAEGRELKGFRVTDFFESEGLTFLRITDDSGKELSVQNGDGCVSFEIPDESVTPYEFDVEFRVNTDYYEEEVTVEFVNRVEITNEAVIASEDAEWMNNLTANVSVEELLTWEEFYQREISGYDTASFSKQEFKILYIKLREQYIKYRDIWKQEHKIQKNSEKAIRAASRVISGGGTFNNDYLEIAVNDSGQFTIGNEKGDPDYDSDDGQKLLYGHPSPGTSETLIVVDGEEYIFTADSVYVTDKAYAVMKIPDHDVEVIEELSLVDAVNAGYPNTVLIRYRVHNTGSNPVRVGIRIMLDTMIASNDDAPFKVLGTGNITESRTFTGSNIPAYYQVYDSLDSPTTLATGYLLNADERPPDKVQFTNWSGIQGASWDYCPSDGSYLGDSAVGIYFDPVVVAGGSSETVSTRYGVGLGIKGNISSTSTLSASQVAFKVVNAVTKDALEGAEIEAADGSTRITGSDGTAVFSLNEVDNKEITVSLKDYGTISKTEDLEGGRQYLIKLKKDGDTVPVITSVMLDGTDLLRDEVSYCEDSTKIFSESTKFTDSDSSEITTVKLQVNSDMPDCVYYFYQEDVMKRKNQSGIFEFKTAPGHNGDRPYIDELSAGKRFYVKCVSKDGKRSSEQILLRVYTPAFTLNIADWDSLKVNMLPSNFAESTNHLLIELLGKGKQFKLEEKSPVDIDFKWEPVAQTLKMGINTDPEFLNSENAAAQNWFRNKVYTKNGGSTAKEKKEFEKAVERWKKNKSAYRIGAFDYGINIMGYGELKGSGDTLTGNLYIVITGELDSSVTFDFWAGTIPMYATVGGKGSIEFSVGGPMNFSNKDEIQDIIYEILDELNIYIGAYGKLGAGHSKVWRIGGRLDAGIEVDIQFKPQYYTVKGTGNLAVEAKTLLWEWSVDLIGVSETILSGYFSDNRRISAEQADESTDTGELLTALLEDSAALQSREYADLDDSGSRDDAVLSNVYTSAAPTIIRAGEKQYRFWLQDVESRDAQNRTALVYSVNTDGFWSAPEIVEDDGTADFTYSLAVDGSDIYAVWMDCNQIFGTDVSIKDTERSLDITLAKLSTEGEDMQIQVYPVTQNDVMDQIPAVYAANGRVYVAWNSMESGYFETVSGNKLNYCTFQNGRFLDDGNVALKDKAVENIQIQEMNQVPTAIYTMVLWDDALTQSSQETHYVALPTGTDQESNIISTEGVPITAVLDGTSYVFWYDEGNVYYTPFGENGGARSAVFSEETIPVGLSSDFTVVSADTVAYLIWPEMQTIENGEGVSFEYEVARVSKYENGVWTKPYSIAELGRGQVSNLTGILDGNGNIVLSWHRMEYDEDNALSASELMSKTIGEYTDIELVGLEYDMAGADVSQSYPIILTLRNNGNTVIESVEVEIEDESFELNDLALLPGECTQKEVLFTVPYSGIYTYVVYVSTNGDCDDRNNTDEFTIGEEMLRLENRGSILQDGQEQLWLEIVNDTNITVNQVRVRMFEDETDGILLYENLIAGISPLSSSFIHVPVSVFTGIDHAYVYLLPEGRTEEDTLPTQVSYGATSVRTITSSTFGITAGEGGNITGVYENEYSTDERVLISAEPEEGFVFWQWVSDNGGVFADEWERTTNFLMPNNAVNITAEFRRLAEPMALRLEGTKDVMSVGDVIQLQPYTEPENVSEHVRYSSSDERIIVAERNGVIRACASGTAVITATCGDQMVDYTVTVQEVNIESMEMISPIYLNGLNVSEDMAILLDPVNASEKIIWSSSDETVAIVRDGVVTSVGCGETLITAVASENPQITASGVVYVTADLESIALSETSLTVTPDHAGLLRLEFYPMGIRELPNVEWKAMNPDVVRIETSGVHNEIATITAIDGGSTLIEATVGNMTAVCTVDAQIPANSISLSEDNITVRIGQNVQMTANLEPANTTSIVTWTSSNDDVVSVDEDGYLYPKSEGTATITAKIDDNLSAWCEVIVVPNIMYVNTVSDLQSEHNYRNNSEDIWIYELSGAEALNVTFSSETYVEQGYDYIILYDKEDQQISKYTGDELQRATILVLGDTVKIQLVSDGSVTDYGFAVTSVEAVHLYSSEFTIDKEPTCTETGEKSRHCTVCGERMDITEIPAAGHKLGTGEYTIDRSATCTEDGEKSKHCTVCGERMDITEIPAAGHKLEDGEYTVDKAATCTEAGEKSRYCKVCHARTDTTEIPAAGHNWTSWEISQKATALVAGTETRTCSSCGKKESRKVNKLKSTYKLNVSSIILKVGQSTNKVVVSELATGDSIKQWKSGNKKIATVTSKGVIKGVKEGSTKITITLASGTKATVKVKVQKSAVTTTKITGLSKTLKIAKGKKSILKPILQPITSVEKISYHSSNVKVASVNSKGVIVAKKAGKTRITVKAGKKKFVIAVTVSRISTSRIAGVASILSVKVGKSITLKPKVVPSNSDDKIIFKSLNTKIATVTAKGKITGKKKGTATITVTSGKKKVICKVKVK